MHEPSVMADGKGMGEISQSMWSRKPTESLNGS